jgi:ribosome-binding protein aMBF1 (putative translation factor)
MECFSRYADSFMIEPFSPAKIHPQGEILASLHGRPGTAKSHFSMIKKSSQKRKQAQPESPPLQRTFIQEWRKARGMSQTDLGTAVSLSTATISQIENAKTGYSQATLEALARVLDVHPIDLLVCDPRQHPKGIWRTVAAILA